MEEGAALFRLDIAITFDFIGDYSVIPRVSFESRLTCMLAGEQEGRKRRKSEHIHGIDPGESNCAPRDSFAPYLS